MVPYQLSRPVRMIHAPTDVARIVEVRGTEQEVRLQRIQWSRAPTFSNTLCDLVETLDQIANVPTTVGSS